MGNSMSEKIVHGTEAQAFAAAETMGAFGLPGTHPQARGKSRVVGIARIDAKGKVIA
jgi:hypothetical protein